MGDSMTIEEVMTDSIQTLNGLSIPVSMHETVGANLARVARNLQACLNVMLANAAKAQAEREAAEAASEEAAPEPVNPTEAPSENTDGETTEGGGGNE